MSVTAWLGWYAGVLGLAGLLADVIGVFVLLSVESTRIDALVTAVFSFDREERLGALYDEINERRLELRDDATLESGEFREMTSADADLLQSVLGRRLGGAGEISAVGFVDRSTNGDRTLGDVRVHVRTADGRFDVRDEELKRWIAAAADWSRYVQGGAAILIGFGLLLVGQALSLVRFVLTL